MLGIVTMLASAGANLVANFIDKGKEEAVDFIKEKTGVNLRVDTDPSSISKVEKWAKNNTETLNTKLADIQNARHMQEMALAQDDKFSKRFIYYFAFFWSFVSVIYIFLITMYDIPKTNQRFADTILGFLMGTIISGIITFFYGSSLGSKSKDSILAKK